MHFSVFFSSASDSGSGSDFALCFALLVFLVERSTYLISFPAAFQRWGIVFLFLGDFSARSTVRNGKVRERRNCQEDRVGWETKQKGKGWKGKTKGNGNSKGRTDGSGRRHEYDTNDYLLIFTLMV